MPRPHALQEAAARVLLLEGCAEAHASDELGETPKDVALRRGLGPLAASIDSWGKVRRLPLPPTPAAPEVDGAVVHGIME
jgi:hypothetical protein